LYEVFAFAERKAAELKGKALGEYALEENGIHELAQFLSAFEVVVGSTGNLGLSVGLSGSALGMNTTVHMSNDAKQWKKALLRKRGANVVEHEGLYESAVAEGRRAASLDDCAHFIDDETSETLFLGYACAAHELQAQLTEAGVDETAPLVVYLPCGVGGAPAGVCWGLKQIFGDRVHVFFAEPTHAPCVTLSLCTGRGAEIAVGDIGIDGKTEADGLAVGRASSLCCAMVAKLIDGCFTVEDPTLFSQLATLVAAEGEEEFIEPSCCAALEGPAALRREAVSGLSGPSPLCAELLEHGVHIFWATGGALVPKAERAEFIKKGRMQHAQARPSRL
jgi:D-serine dehydratase